MVGNGLTKTTVKKIRSASAFLSTDGARSNLGMSAETLRKWVRQAEVDDGEAAGVPTETARELRELRRKTKELEQTIEILKAATTFFARECDPLHR